jgi:hypothetical protein
MEPTVFISHSSTDSHFVARLADDLRAHGYDARAFADIVPKDEELSPTRLDPRLDEAITSGMFFIPVLTPTAVSSPWVHKELAIAVEAESRTDSVKILPVLSEPCVLPPQLGLRSPADFTESYTQGLSSLLAMLAQPNAAPSAVDVAIPSLYGVLAIQSLFAELPRTKQLFELTPRRFEQLVAELLQRAGYEVCLSHNERDAGMDLFAFSSWDSQRAPVLVQCKRYVPNRQVTLELVDSLAAFAATDDASRALVVTTASCFDSFTGDRRRWKARCSFDVDRRTWAQVFLWLAQSRGMESLIQDRVVMARARYSELVDRRFGSQLSAAEEWELRQLDLLLDAADAPFYEPIKARLRAVCDRIRDSQNVSSLKVQ